MNITLYTTEPRFFNDLSESIRAFYPDAPINAAQNENEAIKSSFGIVHILIKADAYSSTVALYVSGDKTVFDVQTVKLPQTALQTKNAVLTEKKLSKKISKLSLYNILKQYTNKQLPWGALTGIRPTKLVYDNAKLGKEGIISLFKDTYQTEIKKIQLLLDIVEAQKPYIRHEPDEMDLYIGIPFCRTRCIYCSFATTDATKGEKLIPLYLDSLFKEMRYTAGLIEKTNKKIRSIYIGGGTPTALNESDFARFMLLCKSLFKAREFTVEAGRPDTISNAKLQSIKDAGADRISINPQSMNLSTLKTIGRNHSPEDIITAVNLAKTFRFNVLNMDIIAGLPGEDFDMFRQTLDAVIALEPENITVHTLSIKKGSVLSLKTDELKLQDETVVAQMVDYARDRLKETGYHPYYLYRQKYQAGNLENVGYCKIGKECIYNIDIMEETTDIAALGSGAISKRIFADENRIERYANCKGITEYCTRIDEMLQRKNEFFETDSSVYK